VADEESAAGTAVSEQTPVAEEPGVVQDASSAEDAVPLAAEGAAEKADLPAAETPAPEELELATEQAPADLADTPATAAARPPTPIPLRPSRLPAQETSDGAADDTTASTEGAGPAEHPAATKAVEEESDPA
jgi:hypothetical protein